MWKNVCESFLHVHVYLAIEYYMVHGFSKSCYYTQCMARNILPKSERKLALRSGCTVHNCFDFM